MTSAIWLNAAAIVTVVGIWAFAVACGYRALAKDERQATGGPTGQPAAAATTSRIIALGKRQRPASLTPDSPSLPRQSAGRSHSLVEHAR